MSRAGKIFNVSGVRKTPPGRHQPRKRPRTPGASSLCLTSRQKRIRLLFEKYQHGVVGKRGKQSRNYYGRAFREQVLANREKAKAARRARKRNRR